MVDTVQDAETQDVLLESMEDITKGGEQFDFSTKEGIATSVSNIVKAQVTGESPSRRRRRNVEGGGGESKSPSQVYTALHNFP